MHLVDATGANAGADYRTVRRELAAYGAGLDEKAEIVALSKVDAVDEETREKQLERLKRAMRSFGPPLAPAAKRARPLLLSTATQLGVTEVLRATMAAIEARRAIEATQSRSPRELATGGARAAETRARTRQRPGARFRSVCQANSLLSGWRKPAERRSLRRARV